MTDQPSKYYLRWSSQHLNLNLKFLNYSMVDHILKINFKVASLKETFLVVLDQFHKANTHLNNTTIIEVDIKDNIEVVDIIEDNREEVAVVDLGNTTKEDNLRWLDNNNSIKVNNNNQDRLSPRFLKFYHF